MRRSHILTFAAPTPLPVCDERATLRKGSADGLTDGLHIRLAAGLAADGNILPIELTHGGARFESMCAVPSLGDTSDSWVFVIACVTVGY